GGLVTGQAATHDDDHCPVDHRRMVSGQALVVAYGTAAAVDPGEGALDTPAVGQHDEADLSGQLGHDLHGDPEHGGGVVDQLAGVAAVGPHQADGRKDRADDPHQQMAGVAVLHVSAGDQHSQQPPAGIGHHMPLAAIGALAGVVAAAGPGYGFRAAHRLGVHQRRGRLTVAAFDLADLFAQRVVQPVEGAVAGPGGEVVLDQRRGWEVDRQGVPLAAGTGHVPDGIHHVAAWVGHRPAAATGLGAADRHQRREDLPLGVGGVRRVRTGALGGQVLAGVAYRGCTVPGQDMDTQGWVFGYRVRVWSPVLLLEDPFPAQPDTPTSPRCIDDHACSWTQTRLFTRL